MKNKYIKQMRICQRKIAKLDQIMDEICGKPIDAELFQSLFDSSMYYNYLYKVAYFRNEIYKTNKKIRELEQQHNIIEVNV